ncbi:RNA polymerase-binding transcription factor DksA [subsurface metagenome]
MVCPIGLDKIHCQNCYFWRDGKCDEGTYGLCDACGQPIDPARLEALPEASLCLSCKAAEGLVLKKNL